MNGVAELSISNNKVIYNPAFEKRHESSAKKEEIDYLIKEGGNEFYQYVMSSGYSMDSNLIVLSSRHHYYYDADELMNVKSVVVLKKLNRIREIEDFLDSHLSSLPDQCNFIGCFVNNKKVERYSLGTGATNTEKIRNSDNLELGIVSKFPFLNMIYSLMDTTTNSYMSEESVTVLLEDHDYKVIDMTESDGLTFFHSQKIATQAISVK